MLWWHRRLLDVEVGIYVMLVEPFVVGDDNDDDEHDYGYGVVFVSWVENRVAMMMTMHNDDILIETYHHYYY